MWYGPFPTLYKNRLPAYYLEGATTWNTQANGRFFLFGFLRKYDKLCAYYDHPPLWSIPHLVLLNIIGGDLGLAMWQAVFPGCDRPSKPRPSLTVSLSLVAQSCRMSKRMPCIFATIHPLKHISQDPTFGTGGISSRNPWRCLKAAFLVSTGTAKEKGWKMCLPSIGAVLS